MVPPCWLAEIADQGGEEESMNRSEPNWRESKRAGEKVEPPIK